MKVVDFPEVQTLAVQGQLRSFDELPQSIEPDLESLEVSQAEREVLDGRWEKFQKDPSMALTLEEFQERLKTRRIAR